MSNIGTIYNAVVAFFGAVIGFMFGGVSGLLITLIVFIVFDFITGVLTGIAEKKLSSETAFNGLVRKVFEILIVSAAHLLDFYVFHEGDVLFTATCFVFISTEGISLVENAARLGVPIPKAVVDTLVQLKVKAGGVCKDIEEEATKDNDEEPEDLENS